MEHLNDSYFVLESKNPWYVGEYAERGYTFQAVFKTRKEAKKAAKHGMVPMGEEIVIHEIHLHKGKFDDKGPHWKDMVEAYIEANAQALRKDEGEEKAHLDERKADLKIIFNEWDTNHDNLISKEELTVILTEIGYPAEDIPLLFEGADTNHDGKIDLQEFIDFIYSPLVNLTWDENGI